MSLDSYIAQRFGSRNLQFYHAENLENFRTYCAAGKLLCRGELMNRNPNGFTVFYSDDRDRSLGVLGRAFGNLHDFGSLFQRARKTIPNVYGPIQLIFAPAVFSSMRDICVTPKSIVNLNQDWKQQAFLSEEKIEELLRVDGSHNQINPAFSFCELSCGNNSISLEFLKCVRVEPLRVSGWSLQEIVENELRTYGIHVPVETRSYTRVENRIALQQLVEFCEGLSIPHSREALPLPVNSLPATFQALELPKKKRLVLWCRYFTHGTIKPLRHDAKWEPNEGEDYTVCELCAPGDERPPSKVSYSFIRGGQWGELALGEGHCDWCGGVSVRCESCGIVHPVSDAQYDVPIECDGGCDLRFTVRQEEDGLVHVELMLSIEDEKMLYGYEDEDESPYWCEDEDESPY
ncbi:hypothetical protein [Corallococcus exiguus]|uniref:Uncharacterized protein n=1 Tax=Corallococcus exiguus TaxID=83462 RepID=A0A7X4YI67_9BACT|nr:hypothetical protein [Corallococcus exiguus]NBC44832.1 hypothetical protein [Corallococcus exiguus]TNV66205.1 hypothetical protein FH620_07555 [Corallococcus exiguus]